MPRRCACVLFKSKNLPSLPHHTDLDRLSPSLSLDCNQKEDGFVEKETHFNQSDSQPSMEMAVNARGEERYGNDSHLGLGLSLSLGIATAAPVEKVEAPPPPPPPRQLPQRAISVAPISSVPATHAQWWNGPAAGLFFSPSSGTTMMDPSFSLERKHQQPPPSTYHSHEMPFLRGIDVNPAAPAGSRRGSCGSEDEEPGASSPNSTLSSLSGKRAAPARSSGGEVDRDQADHTPRAGGGGGSDDEDSAGAGGAGSRKKLRLSKDQAAVLEDSFKEHNTLNPKQKAALAKQLNLKPRQVEVWFQNRRARTKLKQTEVDCEFLKRCCETLTEENRRLQREVAELRALKLVAPHQYARMPPPTTLTMCPSCERLAGSAASADAAAGRAAPAGPWGPLPVLPVFVDGPARRS